MKQTAVEWLINEFKNSKRYQQMINEVNRNSTIVSDVINQAKEIEKEQISKALIRGHNDCGVFTMQSECDEYYNETYKLE